MGLPARDGGLGIPSHHDVAPLAMRASRESAEVMVRKILHMDDRDQSTFKTQAELCREMWELKSKQMAKRIGPLRTAVLLENSSVVSRRWLETIPYHGLLRLNDSAVSAGLLYRTLAKPARPTCRCGKPAELQHEEVCVQVNHYTRHNAVRDTIIATLRRGPATEVLREPSCNDGGRRNDNGLRGPWTVRSSFDRL